MFYDAITDFIFVEDEPQKADILFIPGSFRAELAKHAARLYKEGYAPYILPSGKHSIKKDQAEQLRESGIPNAGTLKRSGAIPDTDTLNRFGVIPDTDTLKRSGVKTNTSKCPRVPSDSDTVPAVHEIGKETAMYATESDFLGAILREEGVPERVIFREPEATFTWENAIYSRRLTEAKGLTIKRAILCCKAFHARRSLMYYQQQFPDTEFFVCPVVIDGISREGWYRTREGIDKVLGEVERCGGQFHEIMADAAGLVESVTP
ncbi:MAG: YdcF family protein [Lachnospiraceae bacterium]|nr:YdcF family protein [Lachnospiraceae bacterium]